MAALRSLDADLQERYGKGAAVIYKKGPYVKALQEIIAALNVGALYFSRRWALFVQSTLLALHLAGLVP